MTEEDARPLFELMNSLVPLSVAEWRTLYPLLRLKTLQPGDYFVRSRDKADTVGFLVQGLLRYFYVDSHGKEFTRYFCQGNNFVSSHSSLVTGQPSAYAIQALKETRLVVFSYADWQALLPRSPVWAQLQQIILESALLMAERRERSLILDDAKTRYLAFLREYPGLEAHVKQYDVASYLGVTPITLSRLRGTPAPLKN